MKKSKPSLCPWCDKPQRPEQPPEVPAPEEVFVWVSSTGVVCGVTQDQRDMPGGIKAVRYVRAREGGR